jgi:prepilin-type N-terminal cleavage/methylation domain-containing protein/prepilin-type processing-associated H-X9-DG protein
MKSLLKSNRTKRAHGKHAAFTLIELVIVVAVVAVWAMMLVPTLARTQPDSRAFQCLNNHAQLCRAWLMYADDNNDKLATSLYGGEAANPTRPMWAAGWLDWTTRTDNTNGLYLTDSRYSILAQYCGRDGHLFKCPADQFVSAAQSSRGWKERVRSMSQNLYVANGNYPSGPVDAAYVQVTRLTGLLNPRPAETWVSVDEHPDSMNEGVLFAPRATAWIDLPANYHDGGAGVAFADGHAESHRWQSSALRFPVAFSFPSSTTVPANDPDLQWLRSHTPRKPGVN